MRESHVLSVQQDAYVVLLVVAAVEEEYAWIDYIQQTWSW